MEKILLAVNGTLMQGLALNQNLLDVQAEFVRESRTSASYRLWSINDQYPAMLRDEDLGNNIDLELWKVSSAGLLELLKSEPPGLCLGKVELEDGSRVLCILGEYYITRESVEITSHGGWRNYIGQK